MHDRGLQVELAVDVAVGVLLSEVVFQELALGDALVVDDPVDPVDRVVVVVAVRGQQLAVRLCFALRAADDAADDLLRSPLLQRPGLLHL